MGILKPWMSDKRSEQADLSPGRFDLKSMKAYFMPESFKALHALIQPIQTKSAFTDCKLNLPGPKFACSDLSLGIQGFRFPCFTGLF